MKPLIASCIVVTAVAAVFAGQMPKYGVTVNAEKKVDFAKFKTYSWTQGQPSAVKEIDAKITEAVDRELAGLGMTKAAAAPDVQVAYYSLTRTDVNLKAKPDEKGSRPQYTVATLMVALLDPANHKRLLRLRIDRPIDTEPTQLEAAINSAVGELFAKYPTRQSK